MNREFFLNILFLIGINVLIKPLYIFGIDLTVQNRVGPEIYGIYFALFNFTFIFQIINDFGIQNFNNRLIAQYRQLVHRYLPQVLSLKMVLALGYLAVVFLASRLAGYGHQYDHLILLISINQILVGIFFYLRTNISGLGLYRTDSVLSALDKSLMILFCSVLLWAPPFREAFRIEWFILAQTLAYAISITVAFGLTLPHLHAFRLRFQPRFWKVILRQSYPFALVIFLMTIYTRIDGVMIERLLPNGDYEAGIYAAGYRLLDALNMVGFLFAGLLLPMFARSIQKGESVDALLGFSFRLIWSGAITVAMAVYFFREEIILLLYRGSDLYWAEVMGYLLFTFIAVSGTYIWGTLLTANGNLRQMNRLLLLGVIANVLLNLLLIPPYRALGAAMATLLTQFAVLFAQMALATSIFRLPLRAAYFLQVGLFALTVAGISYVTYHHLPFDWPINLGIDILLCLFAALAFRMIHPKMLATFFQQAQGDN